MRDPQRRIVAPDAPLREKAKERDKEHLEWDDLDPDQKQEKRVAQRELQPSETVRRPGTDHDREDGGRNRDGDAVPERLLHADGRSGVEDGAVVLEREL